MEDQAYHFLDGCSPGQPFCLELCFWSPHAADSTTEQYFWPSECNNLYLIDTIPAPINGEDMFFYSQPSFLQNDAGDSSSETAHHLQASATSGTGLVRTMTGRYAGSGTAGAWFSYDLSVPAGTDAVELEIQETHSTALNDYNLYLDDLLVKHVSIKGCDPDPTVYFLTPTGLSSRTGDGKLTIKFVEESPAQNGGPYIADLWVREVEKPAQKTLDAATGLTLTYSGNWAQCGETGDFEGTARYSAAADTYLECSFYGSSADLAVRKGPAGGICNVYLDGNQVAGNVDTYSAVKVYQTVIYHNATLPLGIHTIRLQPTGTKNPSASAANIMFDYLTYANGGNTSTPIPIPTPTPTNTPTPTPTATTVPKIMVDNTASAIIYSGSWAVQSDPGDYNGSMSYSGTANHDAEYTFNGDSVEVVVRKGPSGGICDVYLDGSLEAPDLDTYAAAKQYQTVIYSNYSLASGQHTVKLMAKGTKNPSSLGTNIMLDYFAYTGTGSQLFADDFEGDLSKWVNTANCSIQSGWLKVTNQEYCKSNTGDSWTGYTYEADVKITIHAAGLSFRIQDNNNFYMWQLNATTGKLRPHKKVNGSWTVIKEVSYGFQLNTIYHVKIETYGSTIKTYIDSTLVDTTTDTVFSGGRFGMREAGTGEEAYFDNVVVKGI